MSDETDYPNADLPPKPPFPQINGPPIITESTSDRRSGPIVAPTTFETASSSCAIRYQTAAGHPIHLRHLPRTRHHHPSLRAPGPVDRA